MELIFVSENKGISKKNEKPYHLVKLADPKTLENHTLTVDQAYINQAFNFVGGTPVKVEGRLSSPYNSTQFVCTKLTKI